MAARQLRLVLVTPETTLLDERVDALRFPLYDGQIGILPGRAPLVGRLGVGELRLTIGQTVRSYYLEGGFVQVKGDVVSLLTDRALPAAKIDLKQAEIALEHALQMVPKSDVEFAIKDRDQRRARQMIEIARHASKV